MSSKMRTLRDQVRASVEAQLGRGMSREMVAVVDAIGSALDHGTDLLDFHRAMAQLHEATCAMESGTVTEEQVLAALRMTMTAMERGEDGAIALARHVGPLLPQQEACL